MPFLAAAALLFLSAQEIPRLSSAVEDHAGVLSPGQVQEAKALAASLEASDSTQVVLLTVKTTGAQDIADYALKTFRDNGLGQKGRNNGVLIVVAVGDRRVRIQVGTGLEGKLTDALSSRIIRDEMVPKFKSGDYGAGALAGMKAVAAAVKGEYKGLPSARRRTKTIGWGFLAFIILTSMLFSRRRGGLGGFFAGYMIGGMMSGGGRGGWGGGGGGGGWSGGGGFSGGGGASGSW